MNIEHHEGESGRSETPPTLADHSFSLVKGKKILQADFFSGTLDKGIFL